MSAWQWSGQEHVPSVPAGQGVLSLFLEHVPNLFLFQDCSKSVPEQGWNKSKSSVDLLEQMEHVLRDFEEKIYQSLFFNPSNHLSFLVWPGSLVFLKEIKGLVAVTR